MSRQVISGRDEISSKILRRVASARALEIFSICWRFIAFAAWSKPGGTGPAPAEYDNRKSASF